MIAPQVPGRHRTPDVRVNGWEIAFMATAGFGGVALVILWLKITSGGVDQNWGAIFVAGWLVFLGVFAERADRVNRRE
jgi:hypothetical protein